MSKTNIFVGVFLSLLLGAASQAQSSDLTNPTALVDNGPYTGDLQGLVKRRIVRVLTVYGPGRYYLDNGAKGVTA